MGLDKFKGVSEVHLGDVLVPLLLVSRCPARRSGEGFLVTFLLSTVFTKRRLGIRAGRVQHIRGFPKIKGTGLGVQVVRLMVCWDLY